MKIVRLELNYFKYFKLETILYSIKKIKKYEEFNRSENKNIKFSPFSNNFRIRGIQKIIQFY